MKFIPISNNIKYILQYYNIQPVNKYLSSSYLFFTMWQHNTLREAILFRWERRAKMWEARECEAAGRVDAATGGASGKNRACLFTKDDSFIKFILHLLFS